MDNLLTLTHATERDIDLLLVEELKCSPHFVRWIIQKIAAKPVATTDFTSCEIIHSKRRMHNRREIDICVVLKAPSNLPVYILIENKLDTAEQFEQADSYRAESKLLVSNGTASIVLTALVCPSAYARQQSIFADKFDATISYEDIAEYFLKRSREPGELGARLLHRHEMIQQATSKSRRGYQAVPLPIIEQFNARYIALARENYPALIPGPSMLKEGRPGESKSMIFAAQVLPTWDFLPQMRIVHQLREANANINFYTWGDHFTALAAIVASDLSGTRYRPIPTLNKRANGKSGLMIVAQTPLIDNQSGFDTQVEAILTGIRTTDGLRAWIWSHRDEIERWASVVAKETRTSDGS